MVIVGGGVMGSATAYHLKRDDYALSVAVIGRDPSYQRASTVLSDGNVRIQFNLEVFGLSESQPESATPELPYFGIGPEGVLHVA